MIVLIVCNIAILILSIIGFMLAKIMRDDARTYLAEVKRIIANNNRLMRTTMKPINRDGSINATYFTNRLIEVEDEHQANP